MHSASCKHLHPSSSLSWTSSTNLACSQFSLADGSVPSGEKPDLTRSTEALQPTRRRKRDSFRWDRGPGASVGSQTEPEDGGEDVVFLGKQAVPWSFGVLSEVRANGWMGLNR